MTDQIHPSAIVSAQAQLGERVKIHPYAIIDDHVIIGDDCEIGPHAVIHNFVRMGNGNKIHAHAVLGDLPQDLSFDQRETWVEIGAHNVIREAATIHRATSDERITRIGNHCYLMGNTHVGHDCTLGDYVIMANNAGLGGHTHVDDRVTLGAGALVHQFCRIGAYSMIAAFTGTRKDILPFTMSAGQPLKHYRLNSIGLRRNGIKGAAFKIVEQAYRLIKNGTKDLSELEQTAEIKRLQQWLDSPSKRGLSGFL
ncbi:MAG: acyl-ACP--UDP-N-acetylglucosamine O-acyltransferase [Gammaproteobacteria bacterium]|nr:acyl-ACP--UDP-N-acetylglucosamine O-acyltransferase [Gammaproteobacteria bacterium]